MGFKFGRSYKIGLVFAQRSVPFELIVEKKILSASTSSDTTGCTGCGSCRAVLKATVQISLSPK